MLRDRYGYAARFFETDEAALIRYAEETRGRCPFCPVAVEASTPRFPSEVAAEGRIRRGEAIAFPSLFAHAEYNAVTVLSGQHMLSLDGFTPKILRDGMAASLEYLRRVRAVDGRVGYASLAVNYLPPAGSTVVHPHMQTLASSVPFQRLKILLEASRSYFERWRSSYWADLVESEKRRGERYIGRVASSEWVLPFSPRGFYEVDAIVPERVSLLDLTDDDLEGVAEGLSRVLRYYRDRGSGALTSPSTLGPWGRGSGTSHST